MKNQVFLVQGRTQSVVNGVNQSMPEIEQRVVVAHDDKSAMKLIGKLAPEFVMIGYATLKEYEDTAAKLRATLNGVDTGWKMLVAPGLSG